MALPKLTTTHPTYSIEIPSTGQQIVYRPFLVKEEKVLMIALESQDQQQAMRAIASTIVECVQEPIDVANLATFDIEYIFLNIRAKSVGETSTVNIKCSGCKAGNEVVIPLTEIKVDAPEVNNLIELTDTIKLKMRWPSYQAATKFSTQDKSQTEITFDMILACIESVQTPEENIVVGVDTTHDEMMAFIESFSSAQFAKVRDYVSKMPQLKHDITFTCEKCGEENSITLAGITDFF